jgi:sugar O-acyltransferase (sialic acid O-acetyltransferase NeuD family)
MQKTKKLIIFGVNDFAELVYEYFTHDSAYDVMAFTVDRAYISCTEKYGLPVVPFEDLEKRFSTDQHEIFAAINFGKMNRIRQNVCDRAKTKGYKLASYISSKSSVWHNVVIGEHCLILENNTIQPFAKIGNNVMMHNGNVIGHNSTIGDYCYFSGLVVLAGYCNIGTHCFLGVNSTFATSTHVGDFCWIGHGTVLSGNIPEHSLVKSVKSKIVELNEAVLYRSLDRLSRIQHPHG